jgi:hypothetical protein
VGERSNFAIMRVLVAALELVLGYSPARLQQYCAALTRQPLLRARARLHRS